LKVEEDLSLVEREIAEDGMMEERRDNESKLLEEQNHLLRMEEIFWLQKSRVKWLVEGDRNTKFFQISTNIRRNVNRILRIQLPYKSIIEDVGTIKDEGLIYYNELLNVSSEGNEEAQLDILRNIPKVVNDSKNVELMAPFLRKRLERPHSPWG